MTEQFENYVPLHAALLQARLEEYCAAVPLLQVAGAVLIAVHHRGFLKSTVLLQATSSCTVGTSEIKASPSC